MCGIVGLFIKDKALEPQLGQLLSVMLATMCDRGPDSAGFAIYGGGEAGLAKITVQSPDPAIFNGPGRRACRLARRQGQHDDKGHPRRAAPRRKADGQGARGSPRAVSAAPRDGRRRAYRDLQGSRISDRGRRNASVLPDMTGTHGIGHTRMATESAVTTHGRPSFLDRRRRVPRPQRLVVEPQQSAPRSQARRHGSSRRRTIPRSPPPISPRRWTGA